MGGEGSNMQELERFAELDVSDLYQLADRQSVDRGLVYFRDFAVESLSLDGTTGRIIAEVSGSEVKPYRVELWIENGQVEYRCPCPAWKRFGACKHGVAALAAIFAVLKDVNLGGRPIPSDYLDELREGLGVSTAGFSVNDGRSSVPNVASDARIKIYEFGQFGGMRFRVTGDLPEEFLVSTGVSMPSNYAGGFSREFVLKNIEQTLPAFLSKAAEVDISIRIRTSLGEVELELAEASLSARLEYDTDGVSVAQRLSLSAPDGEEIEIEERVGLTLGITQDGLVYRIEAGEIANQIMGDRSLYHTSDIDTFNRHAVAGGGLFDPMDSAGAPTFLKNGVPVHPEELESGEVQLHVNGSIYKNAAGEPEALKFECRALVSGVEVDLSSLVRKCFEPVLHAYSGGLLSTKRRVSGLLDLLRRALAEEIFDDDGDFSSLIKSFPMFEEVTYRGIVTSILEDFAKRLGESGGAVRAVAIEGETGAYFAYPIPMHQLAMLLFSLSEVDTRRGLQALAGGAIPIKRGTSGSDVLRSMLLAAQSLGVSVSIDDLPIRKERLSVSVDAKASGSDIDWFALHPTIACGEHTIDQAEWWRLLKGDLLIQAEDGSWIIPETEQAEASGLRALADMMRVDVLRRRKSAEPTRVSRLQILDWIQLRQLGVRVGLPEEAEQLFRSLIEFTDLPDFEPSKRLNAELRPYQKDGCAWIDFLFQHRFGACLADDMGLGKTIQAISFIQSCFERGLLAAKSHAPVLIVLPPSLVFNWREEWARFAPDVVVKECLSKSSWTMTLGSADVVLSTYDRVRLDIRQIREVPFEVVVFDEAHNLKNITTARTKAAVQLTRRFTLCLTGTPVENHASEFYSVMSLAVPGIFGTLKSFRETFREEPDRVLGRSRPFILRRTKSAILKELPAKEEHVLHLEMTALQKEIYTRTVAEVREEIARAFVDKPEQQAGILALAALLRLRQVCVSPALLGKELPEPAPKLAYMLDKLTELQSEGHAALVFSQFIGGLDALEELAKERGIRYLRMDGRTPMRRREEIVQKFQSEDGPAFFFVSLKTGGVGLNLTRANYVFHLDPWWNPAVENQATDRAHRIGQERKVFVQRLIMQHTIEARMMELKNRKAELFDQLVEQPGRQNSTSGLSRADFDYLLEA